jgi:hypothetical protein
MCGVGGAWGEAAGSAVVKMTPWLMHRGQEGVGYAYLDGGSIKIGTPPDDAPAALLHTRYSTTGAYGVQLQPVYAKYRDLEIAVAFNGTIVNYRQLDPSASFDGEALAKGLAKAVWELGLEAGVAEIYRKIVGAASLVALLPWGLLAVRDPRGVRPLAVSNEGGLFKAASETIALDGGVELPPGVAALYGERISTWKVDPQPPRLCALEYVYFAHPASSLGGRLVAEVRRLLGRAPGGGGDRAGGRGGLCARDGETRGGRLRREAGPRGGRRRGEEPLRWPRLSEAARRERRRGRLPRGEEASGWASRLSDRRHVDTRHKPKVYSAHAEGRRRHSSSREDSVAAGEVAVFLRHGLPDAERAGDVGAEM